MKSAASSSSSPRTREDVLAFFERFPLDLEARSYLRLHARRYLRALDVAGRWVARAPRAPGERPLVCDVGPHFLTRLFAETLGARVNTVGSRFGLEPRHPAEGEHLMLDLNDLHDVTGWRGFFRHDVVYMGEILEHLHAALRMVLGAASRWVKYGGYLVVQTPNAVALPRRWALLRGRHPYEEIREGPNPGHIREHTGDEIMVAARTRSATRTTSTSRTGAPCGVSSSTSRRAFRGLSARG